MGTDFIGRFVEGISGAATLVFNGTGNDYQPVDGMNLTIDHDSDQVMVDFSVECSFSVIPGTIGFAIEVDGSVDHHNEVTYTPGVTALGRFDGSMVVNAGRGRHQYRLMMVAGVAQTTTFAGRNRHMRVMALVSV